MLFRSVHFGEGGQLGQGPRIIGAGPDPVGRNRELGRLTGEEIGPTACGEGDDLVGVTVTADHIEGLGADRPGRTEDRHPPGGRGPFHAREVTGQT